MSQYAIVTDLNRCVGCMACMVACKAANNVEIGNFWNKVLRVGPTKKADYVHTNDVEMYYLPVSCQHCQNPECVAVCPTGASVKLDDGTRSSPWWRSAPCATTSWRRAACLSA